jgi:hypothetical protein
MPARHARPPRQRPSALVTLLRMPLNTATSCSSPHSTTSRTRCHGSIGAANSSASRRHPRPARCFSPRSTCRVKHHSGIRSLSGTVANRHGTSSSSSSTNASGRHSAATLSMSSSSSSARARWQITKVSFCHCWPGVKISWRNIKSISSRWACATRYALMSSSSTRQLWKMPWRLHGSMSSAWPWPMIHRCVPHQPGPRRIDPPASPCSSRHHRRQPKRRTFPGWCHASSASRLPRWQPSEKKVNVTTARSPSQGLTLNFAR